MDEHGGNIYRYRKGIIDFSANINPLGLSKKIKQINLDRILHYPDPDSKDLVRRIARYWKINEENILLGNGSSELIYLIASAFRPRRVFITRPTFSEYERAVKAMGNAGDIDILFVCNPNNPTGSLVDIPAFKGLRVVDEAFMDFVPNEDRYTMIRKAVKNKSIIVLRTFTKFFAIPGLRLGYLAAHKDLIKRLKQNQPPWNINALAQMAGAVLEDKEYIDKTRRLIAKEREFLIREISKIDGFKPFPSVTNFILIEVDSPADLKKKLIKKGILVRDCSNFRGLGNGFIRVAVRKRAENIKLIEALNG